MTVGFAPDFRGVLLVIAATLANGLLAGASVLLAATIPTWRKLERSAALATFRLLAPVQSILLPALVIVSLGTALAASVIESTPPRILATAFLGLAVVFSVMSRRLVEQPLLAGPLDDGLVRLLLYRWGLLQKVRLFFVLVPFVLLVAEVAQTPL